MNEEQHEFHVTTDEYNYLKQVISREDSLADLFIGQAAMQGSKFTITLNRLRAEQLRGFLTTLLAGVGFEKDYSLSQQGQMLEELIDRFYFP